ncbi:type II toxin-antitoxin system RelE/ParE family toxin [Desulfonatronum thiodismutans]|uniref:type II toxin-antitoxin system RelE/ParE family toxin n=1 Tax=Desulfonatronum thiodismutans TaxID=159290 RepID=UPI000A050CDD|nr:type II toxin-antitoxin system RelE/ParE family toxin [Desulfonatronum thiodismutans]
MKNTVRMVQLAEQEMLDAAAYYEDRVDGLGRDFLDSIALAIKDIGDFPERWPVVRREVRRSLVSRFPYSLFYRVDPDEVIVLAVAHQRRRPAYWLGRLSRHGNQ